jgi:hypothetical protein
MNITLVPEIAAEAKALVALAFRNGPVEDLHAGAVCPTCTNRPEFSHISLEEIKTVMKNSVDVLYRLLWEREYNPEKYQRNLEFGLRYAREWDDPELRRPAREAFIPK